MSTTDLPRLFPYQPVRLSVERYHELISAGAFSEHDQVELLEGVVTEKMPKNPAHRLATRQCDLILSRMVPEGWHVQNQEPLTLGGSEPEPDISVVRGQLTDYAARHPGPGDVGLVIEVADTSLVTDRFKARIYAQAGIVEYWIINLIDRAIEVSRQPRIAERDYADSQIFSSEETIPFTVAGKLLARLSVADLLPPPTP